MAGHSLSPCPAKFYVCLMLKSAFFRNITVGAVDCVITGVEVPIATLPDIIPLCLCAVEGDARKFCAICERISAYARHAVGDCYILKTETAPKSMITNARHTIRD